MQLFALPDIYQSTIGKISLFLGGPPVAPLFLAIMGYYLLFSKRNTTLLAFRGLKLILFGLLLNIGINIHLFYKIYNGVYLMNPLELIFGIDIFFSAGMSIIFIALLRKYFLQFIWLAPALAIGIAIIAGFCNPYLTTDSLLKYPAALFGGNYKWSYFPIFPWLSYALIGVSFFQIQKKITFSQNQLLLIFTIGIIPILATLTYASPITHQLKLYYHHDIIFFLWTCVFLILWIILCNLVEKTITGYFRNNFISMLGRNVTLAYAFQWIIIGNVATAVYKSLPIAQSILSVFFIILLTLGFVFLKEKIFTQKK